MLAAVRSRQRHVGLERGRERSIEERRERGPCEQREGAPERRVARECQDVAQEADQDERLQPAGHVREPAPEVARDERAERGHRDHGSHDQEVRFAEGLPDVQRQEALDEREREPFEERRAPGGVTYESLGKKTTKCP